MLVDAMLAWLHFALIFALCGCLFAEAFFYMPAFDPITLRRLQRVDLAYGILAAAVVLSGVARVIWSPKGAAFYLHNPIFWTKIGLFVGLGLASIAPTLHFLALAKTVAAEGRVRIAPRAFRATRGYILAELGLLLLIPCCAALMARGFGQAG